MSTESQKQWTPEMVQGFMGIPNGTSGTVNWPEALTRISDAHNAALADEKEFYRKNYSDLYKELAAERQRREQLVDYWQGVATQEWHKGWAASFAANESNKARLIAEVSAERDAKYVKPIVDALEAYVKQCETLGLLPATTAKAKDALKFVACPQSEPSTTAVLKEK